MSMENIKRPFIPTFDSLSKFECPEWFRDAKLGFWSHWGAQSVAMYGDWYARGIYCEGTDQYRYHCAHYGHPSQFGYKDLVQLWKAECFDPEGLIDLYVAAGARYFVTQAMHHDHFFNYPSRLHRWNSVEMGPHKDIVGLWKAAAKKRGLPFGITEHLGCSFGWFAANKGCDREGAFKGVPYDGNDPEYVDLYLPNIEDYVPPKGLYEVETNSTTTNKWFRQRYVDVIKEVIDLYQPDLLYSDGGLHFGDATDTSVRENGYEEGLAIVAHLYNTSAASHDGVNMAVYNQKDKRQEIYSVGVLDIERSQEPDIKPDPWQTDTCVGGWFYDVRAPYKKPAHVIELLVDIIAKNGNMLLNIPQKPDGTLDDQCTYIVKEMAKWNAVCAEGVYGTRPFRISGEGPSSVIIDGYKETAVSWSSSDFRFTRKGNTIYAFQMKWPENNRAVIKSLSPAEKVKSVRLLGVGNVPFQQPYGILVVNLPGIKPTEYVNCLAIELG